jgi:hypothetical protein
MLDRQLVAAALQEGAKELPPSNEAERLAFAQAVASSLQLEGLHTTREAVLEAAEKPD